MGDDTLEESISSRDREVEKVSENMDNPTHDNEMTKDEQIGFHKGSINTLIAERNELLKMVNVTEQLINAHAAELQKLGVNLQKQNSS